MSRFVTVLLVMLAGLSGAAVAQSAAASPHGNLNLPCADCHQATGWKPARISDRFDHGKSGFPLDGAHASATCLSCHQTLDFGGTPTTCATCHQDIHRGELGAACSRCHSPRSFTDHATMYRAHQQTRFPLEGPHVAVDCQECHTPAPQGGLTWVGRSTECQSCHLPDYQATTDPAHAALGFPRNCTECHSGASWSGATFDHATTAYPLVGAHAAATCASCHANGVYHGLDQSCVACHQPDFDGTTTPAHKAAGFPTDCTRCHTAGPTEWTGAHFDHGTSRFPLTGAHAATTCDQCHGDGVYAGKPMECVSCHQQGFDRTTNPNHLAAKFGTDCATCHTTTKWAGALFDHSRTQFPLTGAHIPLTCQQCHQDGVYAGKPTTCVSCHRTNYDQAAQPPHQSLSFPTTCLDCHATAGWPGGTYDHSTTQFPLTGAHRAASCQQCHGDGVYRGKPSACVSCHQAAYDQTTNPNHRTGAFPTTCTQCHSTTGWSGASFNHDATQFPLTGAHRAASCQDCHADGVYDGKPTTCISCHQADYDQSAQPPHKTLSFPTICQNCHTTTGWPGGTYDHSTTQFPLTGAHLAVTCQQCHGDGVYRGKPSACVSCHQPDYDRTTSPGHRASGFPTTCTQCHTTTQWQGATFDHNATQFPLTGAHRAASCQDCHADGVYDGKPTTCISCHQADYDQSAQPPHKTLSFPTTCQNCHTTTGWPGGTYDHSTTQFPLTGAHLAVTCQQCHGDGVYQGKPTTCVSCHQADYDQTTDPNHRTAMFPTTCLSCHTVTSWSGATFDHDSRWFPIYSGAHQGRWLSCTSCHTNNSNYAVFTCLSCHEHNQTLMDEKHAGRAGYRYDSQACYSCHPRGTH